MSRSSCARVQWLTIWLGCLFVVTQILSTSHGGFCGAGFRNRSVGGIAIDAHGVVSLPTREDRSLFLKTIRERTPKTPDAMTAPVGLRRISLRKLDEAIRTARRDRHGMLPDEINYLAGLQRIEYVLVYPEERDIVLAGPGEGWTVNEQGDVVGVTTGRPVLHLDDLLVALRSTSDARAEGITLSIDPTEEGRRNLDSYLKKVKQFSPAAVAGMEKALGPQQISVTGVPVDSHFARVMLAADFHMKRIAMQLDPSPIEELPSFVQMMQQSRTRPTNLMPRWWLACDYKPLSRSEDGLAWRLDGGVKAMTEDEIVTSGSVTGTGKANPLAQKWADQMTKNYEQLSVKQAAFGHLRNLMDMCVVAALIEKEDLLGLAGLTAPTLLSDEAALEVITWHAPKSIATQCSFLRAGREWIVTASGGVDIDPWQVVAKSEVDDQVAPIRAKSTPAADAPWWWN
ncbi:MAG: DUF1598 domain-containing protein [Pirellulaceae bacterium]